MSKTFYEILGVSHDDDVAVIRKAYVDLAWKYHPDRNSGANQKEATLRMRALNEAWQTVRDPQLRKEYDRRLMFKGTLNGSQSQAQTGAASREWQPFDTSEPEDIDFDDRPIGSTPMPRWLTLAPAAMLAFGVLTAGSGTLVKSGGMFSFGIVVVVLAMAGFLLVPLAAMSRAERDPNL